MNNEPVAWMDDLSFFTEQPDDMDGVTPLYTHPVNEFAGRNTEEVIRMLNETIRQQQAEIEALKKSHIELERGIVKDLNQRQRNEPVAWMLMRSESCVEVTEWYGVMRGWEEFLGDNEKIVELYTHPVKEQDESFDRTASHMAGEYVSYKAELTDEEITEVITKIANNNEYVYSLYKDFSEVEFSKVGIFEFARAILRKAQEK